MDQTPRRFATGCLLALGLLLGAAPLSAQELLPRAYWPAPVGTQTLVVGYVHSNGDILVDPTLPVSGVESDINQFALTYQRFDDLFGRTFNWQISQGYSWSTTQGFLDQDFVNRDLDGRGDLRLRASINLLGAPAMEVAGMQALRADPRPILGFSLSAVLPTGSYNPDRLLNVGANRWSVKPALGLIWPLHPTWLLEAELGVSVFGKNDDYRGKTREQDPIWSSSLHLIKRLRPGFWLSLDLNYYRGGEVTDDDGEPQNLQRNSRGGFTAVFPLQGKKALRFSYSQGVTTRSGGDYRTYQFSFMRLW